MTNRVLTIYDLLENKSNQLKSALGLTLPHPTSQGDLSEGKWIEFLKSFLPDRYSVSKGYVFDRQGTMSQQIDVIVYDSIHSPLIFETDNGEKYITAESVYAVFEVKQKANEEYLNYAIEKIESVRNLDRGSRGIISAGRELPPRQLTKIIGGLLTTDSIAPENLRDKIAKHREIDIVCSARTGTFHSQENGVVCSNADEAIPAFFYLLLDELYKIGTVPAIDIRDYADRALQSFSLERGDI